MPALERHERKAIETAAAEVLSGSDETTGVAMGKKPYLPTNPAAQVLSPVRLWDKSVSFVNAWERRWHLAKKYYLIALCQPSVRRRHKIPETKFSIQ
jgi:hypothetical protein